ncbi:MAG: FAD-binding protein [Rhodobacterales bacterium]|nr:FAD-binding protein [Rhodobacterales bacterium]
MKTLLRDCSAVDWKWTLVGATTRTVIRDGGVKGVVFRLGTDFAKIERVEEDVWQVGAAVPVPAIVAATTAAGFTGLESLAHIPGSVGASLLLDDGWNELAEQVQHFQRNAERSAPLEEISGRKRFFLGATLRLKRDDPKAIRKRLAKVLDPRESQPPHSWYERPTKFKIRQIISSVQLPQVRLRRVEIPIQAPEMLVNLGGGTSEDMALLHKSATERVKKARGIELDSCVRWLGIRIAQQSGVSQRAKTKEPKIW